MKQKKIKIIAEIGWNHMGDLNLAEKMIKAASNSGADYAKFQTWRVKNLTNGPWDSDGRRQIYEKAELKREDYKKIFKICKKYKIKFLTSLFNEKDYELIKPLNCREIKIPSPENRNKNLLKFCANNFETIYLSTGAATVSEIKKSYQYIKRNKSFLFHCVSAYPCEDNKLNISRIEKLKLITPHIGLSDHSKDLLSATLSLPLGVQIIEKHFTIDNSLPGRDNKFAILPNDLRQLKINTDRFLQMITIQNKLIKEEKEIRKIYSGRWTKK